MAPGRCGSSMLAEAVSHKLKLNYVSEPFNNDLHDNMSFDHKNVSDNTLVK